MGEDKPGIRSVPFRIRFEDDWIRGRENFLGITKIGYKKVEGKLLLWDNTNDRRVEEIDGEGIAASIDRYLKTL